VRERAVVGQQQQPLRVPVQATDREHVHALGEEAAEVAIGVGVAHRRRDAARLVQRERVQLGVDVDLGTVDPHLVDRGIEPVAQRRHPPIDLDAAGGDHLLARAARPEPGASERTLEPFD
jgi:hypothetical protein